MHGCNATHKQTMHYKQETNSKHDSGVAFNIKILLYLYF